MEQKHQFLIKSNYTTLVKKIMTSSVVGHLFVSNIITDEMRQQIEAEKTSYDRNRKLLNIILRRGPKAFRGFRMALMKANQPDLSKLLTDGEDTMTEYDKKLVMARSLVVNTAEKRNVNRESQSHSVDRQKSQNEERCRISLDDFGDLFLTAVPFKGEINIHIRHFTESNGRFFATKKGVTFPLARWVMFESLLPDIEKYLQNSETMEEMKWHIGGGVYVSITPGYTTVDIRHFWKPDDALEPVPTRKGVTLNKQKLVKLLQAVEEVRECVPELNDTELCAFRESHQNQLGMLSCPECTPFGYEPKENSISMECNVVGDSQDLLISECDSE
ncbi:uncharacterized protein LOC130049842 [Ostrea edulis]|uniref:uncharacterized protein LOC125654947 n=1 Tax=Ostrea edulis TaxID=37623 RepID=UPI0024AF798D|nr:uncharacterized protein LOC125654947 [Ostrea edulis]XP_056003958.1 uncharacterized protein LOC130049842 [Ostrea edulis]